MNMKMINALGSMFSIVDYKTETIRTFLLTHTLCHKQQVPQDILLILSCITQHGESVAVLWYDKYVHGSLRVDVT